MRQLLGYPGLKIFEKLNFCYENFRFSDFPVLQFQGASINGQNRLWSVFIIIILKSPQCDLLIIWADVDTSLGKNFDCKKPGNFGPICKITLACTKLILWVLYLNWYINFLEWTKNG